MTTNAQAQRAHAAVSRSLREGTMRRSVCEVCGADNAIAHHDDYTRPLDVRWLCRSHHNTWHREHPSDVAWSPTISLRLSDEEYASLLRRADEDERSVSWILRKALREYLEARS